jgi:hypothetical protein
MKLVVLHVTCYIRSFRGRAREVAAPSFSYINERGVVDNIVGIASQVTCRVWVSGKTGVTMVSWSYRCSWRVSKALWGWSGGTQPGVYRH